MTINLPAPHAVLEDPEPASADEAGGFGAFEALESEVRSYCRSWPAVFDRARGAWLYDEHDRSYLDFFAGAGTLNYGHNNPLFKQALLDYLTADRIVHSLDMFTVAKREFLEAFEEIILRPRGLEYRIQFPGPAGTNAVEAALKLARKVTGRTEVVSFVGGFHGTTLGSLAVTSNPLHRGAAGVPLEHVHHAPFDRTAPGEAPDLDWFEGLLEGRGAQSPAPAAVILETVQGEGGVHVAGVPWLRALVERCRRHGVLVIVDDVQMGCGRTGGFFSFELAGIEPDFVCLSKSLSGYGLPLALTLIRPELDVWAPGEHNGTFRGFNPGLVAATAALRAYWRDDRLERETLDRGRHVAAVLSALAASVGVTAVTARGRGLVHGLEFAAAPLAAKVAAAAFERGLLVETAGARDEVVKLLPSLTISRGELDQGLAILADAILAVC